MKALASPNPSLRSGSGQGRAPVLSQVGLRSLLPMAIRKDCHSPAFYRTGEERHAVPRPGIPWRRERPRPSPSQRHGIPRRSAPRDDISFQQRRVHQSGHRPRSGVTMLPINCRPRCHSPAFGRTGEERHAVPRRACPVSEQSERAGESRGAGSAVAWHWQRLCHRPRNATGSLAAPRLRRGFAQDDSPFQELCVH